MSDREDCYLGQNSFWFRFCEFFFDRPIDQRQVTEISSSPAPDNFWRETLQVLDLVLSHSGCCGVEWWSGGGMFYPGGGQVPLELPL